MTNAADDLADWLADLRAHLARGELDGQGDVTVTGGTLPVTQAVRIMLADLDHYDDLTPEQRRDPLVMFRRLHLLGDLWELRARIG